MPTDLGEDIYTLVFDHVDDMASLRSTAKVISAIKSHPLRGVVFRRALHRHIRLSSNDLATTEALVKFLINESSSNGAFVQDVRSLALSLGPSRNADYDTPEQRLMITNAENLVKILPQFFGSTTNLRHLTWTGIPFPDVENLEILAKLPRLESLTVDCATGLWSGRDMDDKDEYWVMKPLFSSLGPKLNMLDLRNVNEDSFRAICENFSALTSLNVLRMDLTCGNWDWDGFGSPQQGASEEFVFPQLGNNIRSFGLVVSDRSVSPSRIGPLSLVDTNQLEELILKVNHCHTWTSVSAIRLFSALSAADFSSLVHLELEDEVRDSLRWVWGEPEDHQWAELGRAFFGLHEFVSELPNLRRLWVDERGLLIPQDLSGDWNTERYDRSTDANMNRLTQSPQWPMLVHTFKKLESLRVGFGPMNVHWIAEVLGICNPKILKQVGFDWDWRAYGKDTPVSPDLLRVLARFPSLTDIHILHPRPELLETKYDDITVADVKLIFKACPNVVRVGIDRNVVWERSMPCKIDDDEVSIQLLADGKLSERVPTFFDAGSAGEFEASQTFGEIDRENIEKENIELLGLLEQLSS